MMMMIKYRLLLMWRHVSCIFGIFCYLMNYTASNGNWHDWDELGESPPAYIRARAEHEVRLL